MADITNDVFIKGGGTTQHLDLEPSWHFFEITVPAALLTATTHDVLLRRYGDPATRCLDVRAQVAQTTDVGTSCTIDIETKLYTIATGATSGTQNIVTGLNGLTNETDGFTNGSSTLGAFGSGVTRDTTERELNVEITNVGSTATTDLVLCVAALLGRAEY